MNYSLFLKKHSAKEGNLVELHTDSQVYEGHIMPSNDQKIIVLKLKSGYNMGIAVERVKQLHKLMAEEAVVGKAKAEKLGKKEGLPTISILHTGGTIASRVDYRTGAVFSSFVPEDLMTMFPELGKIANFNSHLISNMWSDDLRFRHFGLIAEAVAKEIKKGAEGIIIGMGTDNLAVAAAALSFVLEDLPVPVIIVGAQRSSDRGSSDAAMNLICAANFITKSDFAGVAICMHGSNSDDFCHILPPCKTRKLHTSARNAFKAVNDIPIAKVDYATGNIEFFKKEYLRKDKKRKLVIKDDFEDKVGLLKIHIHMVPEQFALYRKMKFKGLVIEGTGLGHTPGHVPNEYAKSHKKIFSEIARLGKSGCVMVMASGCINGRVNMNVYDKGQDLMKMGVIQGEDMLPETAFVKLAWLLGNYGKNEAKALIGRNFRGEITGRTGKEACL